MVYYCHLYFATGGFTTMKRLFLRKATPLALVLAMVLTLFAAKPGAAGAAGAVEPMIAAGDHHCLALKSDGTVWAWGYNGHGQLGDGTTTDRPTPVQVTGLSGVTAIAAAEYHSLALKSDGTVWAWGRNEKGELGDGTTIGRRTPVQVTGLSGITAIFVGDHHSFAIKSDGTVWVWGWNNAGQLGDGTTTDRPTPVQATQLSGFTTIAPGENFALGLKSDGTVWGWGVDLFGIFGNVAPGYRQSPVQNPGLSGVTAIAAGSTHGLALKSGGTVWTWGNNRVGQLGNGTASGETTSTNPIPAQVAGLSGVVAIEGHNHSLALKSDGTVWGWGHNGSGQLGAGSTTTYPTTPVQAVGLSGGVAIAAGIARHRGLSRKDAFQYLHTFGGIEFMKEHYEAEHLLSLDDTVEDLGILCRDNGGNL